MSRRLASYFVADDLPAALVDRMTQVFAKTHGDLRAAVDAMVNSKEFTNAAGNRRDPMPHVVASLGGWRHARGRFRTSGRW